MTLLEKVKKHQWAEVLEAIIATPYELRYLYPHKNNICHHIAKRNVKLLVDITKALYDTNYDTLFIALNAPNVQGITPLNFNGLLSLDMYHYFLSCELIHEKMLVKFFCDHVERKFEVYDVPDVETFIYREISFLEPNLSRLHGKLLYWSIRHNLPCLTHYVLTKDPSITEDILTHDYGLQCHDGFRVRLSSMLLHHLPLEEERVTFYFQLAQIDPTLYEKLRYHYTKFCNGEETFFDEVFRQQELAIVSRIIPPDKRRNDLLSVVLTILEQSY